MANDCGCDNVSKTGSSCRELLDAACIAYNEAMMGNKAQMVRWSDETVQYQQISPKQLFEHIQRLHASCPTELSRAIVGGSARALGVSFGCPR